MVLQCKFNTQRKRFNSKIQWDHLQYVGSKMYGLPSPPDLPCLLSLAYTHIYAVPTHHIHCCIFYFNGGRDGEKGGKGVIITRLLNSNKETCPAWQSANLLSSRPLARFFFHSFYPTYFYYHYY